MIQSLTDLYQLNDDNVEDHFALADGKSGYLRDKILLCSSSVTDNIHETNKTSVSYGAVTLNDLLEEAVTGAGEMITFTAHFLFFKY